MTRGEEAFMEAISLARDNGLDIDDNVPATSQIVTQMGARLGVRLPPSYVAMLTEFGTLGIESMEVYGYTAYSGLDGTGVPDVVAVTRTEREEGRVTGTMVPITASGYGPIYVLDCAEAGPDGEAPVYEVSGAGVAGGRDRLADSFGEFLLNEVRRQLDD